MSDSSFSSSSASHAPGPPKGSAWTVYSRLLGYAWAYRAKLALSVLFALIVAGSFTSILVGVGTVINVAFYSPGEAAQTAEGTEGLEEDPAEAIVEDIHKWTGRVASLTGYEAAWVEPAFRGRVDAIRKAPARALRTVCVIVIVLTLVAGIARFFQEYIAGGIGANITVKLGMEMYENIMRQSVGFFESRSSGDILARFANDIIMVNRGLAGVFVKMLREPFKILAFLMVALSADVQLTLIGLCVLPPVAYVIIRIGKKVRKSVGRSLQKIASMVSVINESLQGIAIVKGFRMEAYEIGRLGKEIGKLRRYLLQVVKADAAIGPITEFILMLGVVGFMLVGGAKVEAKILRPGDLITLFMAIVMMLDPIRKLTSVNNMIQTSVASAERVFEFIDAKPAIVDPPDAKTLPPMAQALRFNKVSFGYNEETQVLHEMSFEIKKGEMVALVGFSGAGKSTIAKLVPRFYDVTSGSITIDGTDIREATVASLRDQLSIVTQDTILFSESVRENIAFGREDFPDDRIIAAAHAAHAAEFIDKLPKGYDTLLGESGGTLSGGQRQRLAIARAIIKDPSILILDEATSSLDTESERAIQLALDEFVEGRTAIVIAHRLSTVRRADRIFVIEEGRLAEEGTHDALLAQGGIYKRLYDVQLGQQADAT